MLIDAGQLSQKITARHSIAVMDCRFALPGAAVPQDYGYQQYLEGHIPGAIYADLEKDLSAPAGALTGRHPLPAEQTFLDQVQKWGITPELTVVVVDDANAMMAARLWWMLHYWLGHPSTLVLDKGYKGWLEAGLPLEKDVNTGCVTDYRYQCSGRYLRSMQNVQAMIAGKQSGLLVDARGHERFTGEEEPIDPVAGHIPGAINLPCTENLMQDGKFRSAAELKARFLSAQQLSAYPETMVHSCGSGVTACHNILAMELAGMHGSALYAGSWSEWISDPVNPVATGE